MKLPTLSIILAVIAIALPGCVEALETPTTTPELPTAIIAQPTPEQASATSTARNLAPSATFTESPTIPAPTILIATAAPTDSDYPTPTALTARPTSGIIIVTPLGGEHYCDFTEAYFTPTSRMRVRDAANVYATVIGYLDVGETVQVCDEIIVGDQTWLCFDFVHDMAGNIIGSDCGKVVAYQIGITIFGRLEVVQP